MVLRSCCSERCWFPRSSWRTRIWCSVSNWPFSSSRPDGLAGAVVRSNSSHPAHRPPPLSDALNRLNHVLKSRPHRCGRTGWLCQCACDLEHRCIRSFSHAPSSTAGLPTLGKRDGRRLVCGVGGSENRAFHLSNTTVTSNHKRVYGPGLDSMTSAGLGQSSCNSTGSLSKILPSIGGNSLS